jgi:uncharacterized protein (DUF924 family)
VKPESWFSKDSVLDAAVRARFQDVYETLRHDVPQAWLQSPEGYAAAVIVLDQFPRNMFRDSPRAFATDSVALDLAKDAIAKGFDRELTKDQRLFLYVPFQHSEKAEDQARSIELYEALGNPVALDFAVRHKDIIDRFGRFPHRNETLGRTSTPEEIAFLKEPGSSF